MVPGYNRRRMFTKQIRGEDGQQTLLLTHNPLPKPGHSCQLQSPTPDHLPSHQTNKYNTTTSESAPHTLHVGTLPLRTLEDTRAAKTMQKRAGGVLSPCLPSRVPHTIKERPISVPTAVGERSTLAIHDKSNHRDAHAGTGQANARVLLPLREREFGKYLAADETHETASHKHTADDT